jgi:iron(III) transport system permease protein
VLPFSALAVVAFSRVWEGVINFTQFTWANFSYVLFEFDLTTIAIKNSLFLGFLGAVCIIFFSVVLSYLQLRTRVKGRALLDYITSIPIGVPGIVMGTAMLIAWIRTPLYGTVWVLLVAFVARFFPYGIRIVSSGLHAISPELDECSRITGASWIRSMKRITIPLLKPSLTAGWVLLFILIVKELPVAVLLSQKDTTVMSVALITLVSEKLPGETASFALIQTVMIFVATIIYRKVTKGEVSM